MMLKLLAILIWASTWLTIFLRLKQSTHPAEHGKITPHNAKTFGSNHKQPSLKQLNIIWSISLALHGIALLQPLVGNGTPSFSLLSSLSMVAWLSSLLLYIAHLRRPLETLGLFIIPLVMGTLVMTLVLPQPNHPINLDNGLGIHILLSLLAYSMLALAALQALLLAIQSKQLHNHKPNGLIRTLPPLQDMESLLFQLLTVGIALLTLGLLSGFIFLDGFLGKQVAHKTLLSIIAWLTFATLLFGHWRYGWRGKIAIRWTLTGFILLMLAFLGSKLVLEYVVATS